MSVVNAMLRWVASFSGPPEPPSGSDGPGAGLAAQELRVAQPAAEGLTDREIAARVLMNHRTVGHHPGSVHPWLDVTSRAELARIDMAGDLRLRTAGGGE